MPPAKHLKRLQLVGKLHLCGSPYMLEAAVSPSNSLICFKLPSSLKARRISKKASLEISVNTFSAEMSNSTSVSARKRATSARTSTFANQRAPVHGHLHGHFFEIARRGIDYSEGKLSRMSFRLSFRFFCDRWIIS